MRSNGVKYALGRFVYSGGPDRDVSSPPVSYAGEESAGAAPVHPGPCGTEANGEDHDGAPDS